MSWDQLDLELAEMFDAYSWHVDEYQIALARLASKRCDKVKGYRDAWRAKNPERVKAYQKTSRQRAARNKPEHIKKLRSEQNRRYREKHIEALRARHRDYYAQNKERILERRRAA